MSARSTQSEGGVGTVYKYVVGPVVSSVLWPLREIRFVLTGGTDEEDEEVARGKREGYLEA